MERLPWFPCYSKELLSTLGGMWAVEQHVYLIILLRIYDSGGVCRDSVDAISMRTGNKRHIVGRALASLVKSGRIVLDASGGMTNPKASLVLAEMAAFHERQKQAGKIGAAARWNPRTQSLHNSNTIPPLEKPQQNQQNGDAVAMRSDAHLHLHKKERKKDAVNGADAHSVLAQVPDAETELYRRGKQVLGASSGGLITQLLKAKDGKINLARAAIETAAGKENPREYIGAVIRGAVVRPGDVVTYVDGRL
jgi:hypothetical protein